MNRPCLKLWRLKLHRLPHHGYFDSKVLSRQHAEVWEDGGRIYIKDVKSSNGTFINGDRLSGEGVESEQYELKTDDIVVRQRDFALERVIFDAVMLGIRN